jgi:arylsulfatase
LTGRNHHTVGFGSIGELSSGFPGYTAFVPKDCAPFPKILRENGYSTAAIGKWHMTPDGQQARPGRSTAGPPAGASTTSGGSWAAKPASGTR